MGKTIVGWKENRYKGYTAKELFKVGIQKEVNAHVDKVMERAISIIARQVLDRADDYVLEDEGDLRRSGRVDIVEKRGNTWFAEVVYGDSEVNYAFFVHENLGGIQNVTRSGSQPFFLQRAGDEILTQDNFKRALQQASQEIKI